MIMKNHHIYHYSNNSNPKNNNQSIVTNVNPSFYHPIYPIHQDNNNNHNHNNHNVSNTVYRQQAWTSSSTVIRPYSNNNSNNSKLDNLIHKTQHGIHPVLPLSETNPHTQINRNIIIMENEK